MKAGETKVLGVKWNPLMDSLVFDFREVSGQVSNLEPTKRDVVGASSKFYDPLGFVTHVTIASRFFSRNYARPSLTGTMYFRLIFNASGSL